VLFGSDGPWLHPGVEITKVLALDLDAEAQALILGGNLMRLISSDATSSGGVRPRRLFPLPAAAVAADGAEPNDFRDPWSGELPG
jgi:hypothetical protein